MTGSILGYQLHAMYPEGALDEDSLSPAVLLRRTTRLAEEGLSRLYSAAEQLASLARLAGEVEPPEVVYRDDHTGKLSHKRP
jgi:hypothetical protein